MSVMIIGVGDSRRGISGGVKWGVIGSGSGSGTAIERLREVVE